MFYSQYVRVLAPKYLQLDEQGQQGERIRYLMFEVMSVSKLASVHKLYFIMKVPDFHYTSGLHPLQLMVIFLNFEQAKCQSCFSTQLAASNFSIFEDTSPESEVLAVLNRVCLVWFQATASILPHWRNKLTEHLSDDHWKTALKIHYHWLTPISCGCQSGESIVPLTGFQYCRL